VSNSKKPHRVIITGLLIYLLLAIAGCTSTVAPPQGNPAIRGTITSRNAGAGDDRVGSILVEGQVEADTSFDKASIAITAKTRIFEQVGPELRPTTFEALQMGRPVAAWFDGPVAESYPVQATASDIVILK
jgi:hypothetical protein